MTIVCEKCGHANVISPRRRQKHSNLLHKVLAYIANELGLDVVELKIELKLRYGVWVAYPMDTLPEWPGKFVCDDVVLEITGHLAVFLKSESAYDIDEEHELMRGIKAYAYLSQVDLSWMEE